VDEERRRGEEEEEEKKWGVSCTLSTRRVSRGRRARSSLMFSFSAAVFLWGRKRR